MDTEKIRSLSKTEALILAYKCSQPNITYSQLAVKWDYSEQWITIHASRMYAKLGVDPSLHWRQREKVLEREVCPILRPLLEKLPGSTLEEKIKSWPLEDEPDPQPDIRALIVVQMEMIEQHQELIEQQSKELVAQSGPIITVRRGIRPWVLVVGMLLTAIVTGVVVYSLTNRPVSVPIPTQVATQVAVVVPTITVKPTATSVPVSPTPEPYFFDQFDGQLSPKWQILSGFPKIVDGRLESSDGVLAIKVGDNSLENFVVEFDFAGMSWWTITFNDEIQYSATGGELTWNEFRDNQWKKIDSMSAGAFSVLGNEGHFSIQKSGTTYTVYINGNKLRTLTYGKVIRGPITFSFTPAIPIDNFKITKL